MNGMLKHYDNVTIADAIVSGFDNHRTWPASGDKFIDYESIVIREMLSKFEYFF